jgi:hypothetical protein
MKENGQLHTLATLEGTLPKGWVSPRDGLDAMEKRNILPGQNKI